MKLEKSKIIIFNIIFISCLACNACNANVTEEKKLAMIGFYDLPEKIIEKLNNENAEFKEHFLLGSSYKKTGEPKKAILHFANSCFKHSKNLTLKLYPSTVYKYVNEFHIKSDYYNDAIYEIAALFFDYREFAYTIKFIDLISKSNSALYRDAVLLKANAMTELGKLNDAISLLKKLLPWYDDINSRSLIHIRISSVYEKQNDYANSIKQYFIVLNLSVSSWQSGIACERILQNLQKYKLELTENEEFLLAVSLYNNAKFTSSLETLKSLLKRELKEPLKSEAAKYAIKAYIRTGKLNESDYLISQYKNNSDLYTQFLKTAADELWKMKKKQAALNIYQMLYKSATDTILKESHKRIVQSLINYNANFESKVIEYKDKYPKDKAAEYFLWAIAKSKIKERDNKSAIKYMEESLSLFPKGTYSARNRFWLAKLYENAGKEIDAIQKIKEMARLNPNSAYTWKKLDLLKNKYKIEDLKNKFKEAAASRNAEDALFYNAMLLLLEKNFTERDGRLASLKFIEILKKYQDIDDNLLDPAYKSKYKDNLKDIEKYFIIGYADGIIRETGIIPNKSEYQFEKHRMLAHLGSKYNNYYFSVTSILMLFKYYNIKENLPVLSVNTIQKLFPAAFSSHIEKLSEEKKIAKEMVYAVIKAESSFNHKAVSSAGAIGLMQLMPPTAKQIARELKMKEFNLKDPLTSITFGIKYITWLNKMFKGDFENIVAGYNAGAGNVKKWIKDSNADDDYSTEFIPFQETRYYILRTYKFLIQYKLLYDSRVF